MKKEEIKYFCDICKEKTNEKDCFRVNYPVIFVTNQIDGVSSKPYIEQKQIDICRDCADKVLKITASGCQGYNEYNIINESTKWQKLKEWLKNQITDLRHIDIKTKTQSFRVNDAVNCFRQVLNQIRELEGEDE